MAKKKFPKETGGGWYELSNGEKVQGEDEAQAQEDALAGGSGDSGSDETPAETSDAGTGLENLAVDREDAEGTGDTVGADEDDPRSETPVAGKAVIGRAESGEPIVEGGVPLDSGVPEEQVGVNDPTVGVSASVDEVLAQHEANRDQWMTKDEDAYDGSPADRLKTRGTQTPTDGGDATDVD